MFLAFQALETRRLHGVYGVESGIADSKRKGQFAERSMVRAPDAIICFPWVRGGRKSSGVTRPAGSATLLFYSRASTWKRSGSLGEPCRPLSTFSNGRAQKT